MVSSTAPALRASARLFPYDKWSRALPDLARQYRDNYPCPHVRLIDFLKPETASAMAEEFPQPSSEEWTQYKHANENKLGMAHRELFPPTLGAVTDELNSAEFVAWLSELIRYKAPPCAEFGAVVVLSVNELRLTLVTTPKSTWTAPPSVSQPTAVLPVNELVVTFKVAVGPKKSLFSI